MRIDQFLLDLYPIQILRPTDRQTLNFRMATIPKWKGDLSNKGKFLKVEAFFRKIILINFNNFNHSMLVINNIKPKDLDLTNIYFIKLHYAWVFDTNYLTCSNNFAADCILAKPVEKTVIESLKTKETVNLKICVQNIFDISLICIFCCNNLQQNLFIIT